MRYIDINLLKDTVEILDWKNIEKNHIVKLESMSPSERADYFATHRDWNLFQEAMIKLFGYKCWYSEAPIGAGDFEIDHFRPKNRSKHLDKTILKENGYWWLAYNWKNYRLSGGLVNKLRKDRLNSSEEVKGKGDYFPLDLVYGKKAKDIQSIRCELPILLDPIDAYDVSLLTFDQNGEVLEVGTEDEMVRAKWSIFFYHLDLEQLSYQRSQKWNECQNKIEEANDCYLNATSEFEKRNVMRICYGDLRKMTRPESYFSAVAIACLKTHANMSEFEKLLKNFNY